MFLKYASDGKRLIIESNMKKETATINVKDFGETNPEEKRELIFKCSIQLENNQKRGRGLGLAIAKRIATVYDGKMKVKPITPKGNIFYLKIPI